MTDKPLTKQQQHQRDVWENARRCQPKPPLSDVEILKRQEAGEQHRASVNELLALINAGEFNKPSIDLTIVTPDGPKAFNMGAVLDALQMQCYTWRDYGRRDNYGLVKLSPFDTLFPGLELDKKGEKTIKLHYHVNSAERVARLVITRATPDANGDTLDQPRYEEEHTSTVVLDNCEWRCVVNDFIASFPPGYVHMYSQNFEYIWDYEACCNRIIPEGATGTDPRSDDL